jgi:hypothetical protein
MRCPTPEQRFHRFLINTIASQLNVANEALCAAY